MHGTQDEAKVRGPGVVTGRSGVIGQVYLVLNDFWPLNTTFMAEGVQNSFTRVCVLLSGNSRPPSTQFRFSSTVAKSQPGTQYSNTDPPLRQLWPRSITWCRPCSWP